MISCVRFVFEEDAESFYRVLPKRLGKFGLEVAPEKTRSLLRFSRFHPSMKAEVYLSGIRVLLVPGLARSNASQAPDIAQETPGRLSADQAMDQGQSPPQGKAVYPRGSELCGCKGHYNYYGLRGNPSASLYRFYKWAKQCAFKWLNRRGGKRKSFTWGKVFSKSVAGLFRYSPP